MRSSRNLALLATVALCVVLAGCARVPREGGARGRTPDKARKDAETLALNAVTGAADAQAKAIPALYRPPEPHPEQVREQLSHERLPAAVRGLGGLVAVTMAGFLFLRLDQRSKGTLTVWLALAAVVLAAGGVAAAVLV